MGPDAQQYAICAPVNMPTLDQDSPMCHGRESPDMLPSNYYQSPRREPQATTTRKAKKTKTMTMRQTTPKTTLTVKSLQATRLTLLTPAHLCSWRRCRSCQHLVVSPSVRACCSRQQQQRPRWWQPFSWPRRKSTSVNTLTLKSETKHSTQVGAQQQQQQQQKRHRRASSTRVILVDEQNVRRRIGREEQRERKEDKQRARREEMRTTTTTTTTARRRRRRAKRSEDCLRLTTTTTTNIANVPSNRVTGMEASGPAAHSPRRGHCWGPSNSVAAATIAKSGRLALLAIVLLHLTMGPSQCHTTSDASNHRSAGILEIGRQHSDDASSQHTVANYNQPKSAGASRNLVLIQHQTEQPDFVEPIGNHTVAVGRDAQLACKISNLGNYRTAWLRVEDKGILTIHNNVITRNYRFGLMNNEDESSFVLTIRNVQPSDKGGYMCQINSVPMKYAVGYLDVLTPPVFDETGGQASSGGITNKNDGDAGSSPSESDPSSSSGNHDQEGSQQQQQMQQPANSSQVTVVEGSDATLTCLARGHPKPTITWRREDGRPIIVNGNELVGSTASDLLANAPTEIKDTTTLSFVSVNRFNSGAYLCIASNGVQPSASKRQLLDVQYSPTITVPETEISGWLGEHEAQLECYADSNPGGSYHWVKLATSTTNTDRRPMVANQEDDLWLIEHDELMPSDKFDIVIKQINSEKVRMILIIRQVEKQDFSWYKCIAKNSLGLQSNFVRFYEAPMGQQQHQTPAAAATTTTTTASSSFSFKNIIRFNDFIGGGSSSGSSSQTTGQQQQQDDNKLNLPQNDDSRLSFQRSSSSSSSARSAGSVSPISQLLLHYTTAPLHLGSSVTLQSYLLYHCQFAALFSLVMITTLLNLLSATTGITRLQALDPQQQQQQT